MPNIVHSLNIAKLMNLRNLEQILKANENTILQKKILLQKSFDNKMLNLSLTPRPSKTKRPNEEAISNYPLPNKKQGLCTKTLTASSNVRASQPYPSSMQLSICTVQQAFKAKLNQLIARDLAIQKKLSRAKLAKKDLEEKRAQMEFNNRMGM